MELASQLFGYLVLTFLGIVVPLLILLLSIFQEGVSKLTAQYEQEKVNSEENIKEQLKKLGDTDSTDVKKIEQSIDQLKAVQKVAKRKLSYLEPKKQIVRLFILLLTSFIGVLLTLIIKTRIYGVPIFSVISLILFFIAIYLLWRLLCILIEVKGIIDRDKNEMEKKNIELLSKIATKGEQYFLQRVYIRIENENIDNDEKSFELYANTQKAVGLSVVNLERRMAKNIEIGFIFPRDFMLEKTSYYSHLYDSDGEQIIRYNISSIQGNTNRILGSLIITPIKEGEYTIRSFIKAENIESTYRNVTFIIREDLESPL